MRLKGQWAQTETRRFFLNTRKYFFSVRVTKDYHRLSGEIVESPSSDIFKSHLDMAQGNRL